MAKLWNKSHSFEPHLPFFPTKAQFSVLESLKFKNVVSVGEMLIFMTQNETKLYGEMGVNNGEKMGGVAYLSP